MKTRALDVQNLTAKRQNCLRLAVARLLGAAACGIALYDENFGIFRFLGRTVGKLARQRERVEDVLAARHLTRFASSLAGFQSLRRLPNDLLSGGGVLLQIFRKALGHGVLHERADLGVAELRFRLSLELRVMQLYGNNRCQALTRIVTRKIGILLLQDALAARIVVDRARHGLLEAVKMRATLVRVDVVGESHDGVRRIGCRPLHGHFHRSVGIFGREVNGLVKRFLALVQVLDEVDDAAREMEHFGARLGRLPGDNLARILALIVHRDFEALV